uniref:Uncharacterized protein n=1 Tax=Rhizophora mucronata TaxID=61149 RepID=A0A2P2NQ32_RHIMU
MIVISEGLSSDAWPLLRSQSHQREPFF